MVNPHLSLQIITPKGVILKKEGLSAVNLSLEAGYPIGIRPGHAPLLAVIKPGMIKFRSPGQEGQFEVNSGILRIRNNTITILTSDDTRVASNGTQETIEGEKNLFMQTPISPVS
jgi:F-type H+-transporting ATPase subunit epsilon